MPPLLTLLWIFLALSNVCILLHSFLSFCWLVASAHCLFSMSLLVSWPFCHICFSLWVSFQLPKRKERLVTWSYRALNTPVQWGAPTQSSHWLRDGWLWKQEPLPSSISQGHRVECDNLYVRNHIESLCSEQGHEKVGGRRLFSKFLARNFPMHLHTLQLHHLWEPRLE